MSSPTPVTPPSSSSSPDPTIPVARVLGLATLALALSTALSIPFALGILPAEATGLVVPLAQLIPMLAAITMRRRGERIRDALALVAPSRRALAIGLVASVLVFCIVSLVRQAGGSAAGLVGWSGGDGLGALALAVPLVAVMQTVFALGEETGWRGWLHTQLRPLGFWPASLLIGALWALWHVPIVLALGLGACDALAYLLVICAVGPVLSALREVGGCVWPAVLGQGRTSP